MPGTFFGVEIARRGLSAHQRSTQISQNNVANAHTEGYSRQRPVLAATNPYKLPILNQGQLGSGVEVKEVQRLRDIFLDRQLRANLTEVGFWEGQDNELAKAEALFTEPAQNSVNDLLASFWNYWQELSNNPQEASARISVTQTAVNLTTRLNYLAAQLNTAQEEITENLDFKVTKLNELAAQLAEINKSIAKGLVKENHALMDQRDLILDQMTRLAELEVSFEENNQATVTIKGQPIVEGQEVYPVEREDLSAEPGGEMGGLLAAWEKVSDYLAKLGLFMETLSVEVNVQHQEGYTLNGIPGSDFFTLTEAANGLREISVNEEILKDPNNIAAAQEADAPGDGRNALAIAVLREKTDFAELGNNSLAGFYRQLVTDVGTAKNQAAQNTAQFQLIAQQFESQRQSLSGVLIDEELTLLMQYQYAYQASAQALKIMDDLLDTLVNRIK
ncbi:MAG: flagellar hook-associated protein FlgK [Peptococcaceae bacterium]